MKKGFRDYLDEANREVDTVTPEEAAHLLEDENTLFVDLRDPREVAREGAIPGAKECPRGMLEFWIDPESPYHKPYFAEDKTFVFFCAGGWRSALAAKTAQDMGWKRCGTSSAASQPGRMHSFRPRQNPGSRRAD